MMGVDELWAGRERRRREEVEEEKLRGGKAMTAPGRSPNGLPTTTATASAAAIGFGTAVRSTR